jgi:hypothetical protein
VYTQERGDLNEYCFHQCRHVNSAVQSIVLCTVETVLSLSLSAKLFVMSVPSDPIRNSIFNVFAAAAARSGRASDWRVKYISEMMDVYGLWDLYIGSRLDGPND